MNWIEIELEQAAAEGDYPIGDGDHGQIKPTMYQKEGIPYIRVSDIGWGTLDLKNVVYISDSIHKANPKSELKPNDVLIAKTGATIGKCCIIPETLLTANTTSSVGKISLYQKIMLPKWLLNFFLSRKFKDFMWSISERTAQPGFNNRDIKKFIVPLPPLTEQHRIVAKLDALFAKIESNKQRLEKIPQILKRFRQSVLAAAVSGRLTEDWRNNANYNIETDLPNSWQLVKIDKLIRSLKTDLRTGPFGTALKKSEHQLKGIPVWGIESIGENGAFTGFNKIFITKEKANELKSFEVKGGNIIISRSGTVGEICILPENVEYGLISTNLMKIVLNNDVILSKYFCWLFAGSQIVIDKLRELCSGSTRIFLTQTILKQIEYSLPPLKEQKEIVRQCRTTLCLCQ